MHPGAQQIAEAVLIEHPNSRAEVVASLAMIAILLAGNDPTARGAIATVFQSFVDGMLLELEGKPENLN